MADASLGHGVWVAEGDQKRRRHEVEAVAETTAQLELEGDAPEIVGPQVTDAVPLHLSETTLNVIPSLGGRVLAMLSDGGLQYFLAAARFGVGIRSGRYFYEVRIIEFLNPSEPQGRGRAPLPRQLLRVGFSAGSDSLLLGCGVEDDGACFDSEGSFLLGGVKTWCSSRFGRDQVVAVLLNLDQSSTNANTISLFVDGKRASKPQNLPERLRGVPLFPHVSFKNVALELNFGPLPMSPLPFKCHMLRGIASTDADVRPKPSSRSDGRFEVLFPISIPDEGSFEWLDNFLRCNPEYVELSDRMILDWALKSGVSRSQPSSWKNSVDKPDMSFGLPFMEDSSVRRILQSVVSSQPRNYVVMEVKSNLIKEERQILLNRFNHPRYCKIAHVVMGEPPDDFKKRAQDALLKDKQALVEEKWRSDRDLRKEQRERGRALEAAKKAVQAVLAAHTNANDLDVKKEDSEVKEEDQADKCDLKEEGQLEKKEEVNEETKEEIKEAVKEELNEEHISVKEEPLDEDEEPPVATLTENEKNIFFPRRPIPDLTSWVLGSNFTKFSLPENDEGFEEVRYAWADADGSGAYLRAWIKRQKIETRMEDLKPSEWFMQSCVEWQQTLVAWRDRQADYQVSRGGRSSGYEAFCELEPQAGFEAGDGNERKLEGLVGKADAKQFEDLDISVVQDVCSTSASGMPLFVEFEAEDWALLALRVELYLLVQAFKRDCGDPERIGIHDQHLSFYFNKYFRKVFNIKPYGVSTNKELVAMIEDTVFFDESTSVLQSRLPDYLNNFDAMVKLTEESRRERRQRIEAGDDQARLRFAPLEPMVPHYARQTYARSAYPGGYPGAGAPMGRHYGGKEMYGKSGRGGGFGSKGHGGKRRDMVGGRFTEPLYPGGVLGGMPCGGMIGGGVSGAIPQRRHSFVGGCGLGVGPYGR